MTPSSGTTSTTPVGEAPDQQDTAAPPPRLNVNLNEETAELLRRVAKARGISYTEAVRRAIAVWAFVEDEVEQKHRVQSYDPEGGLIRELVLL